MSYQVVFIIGAARSGTNMLRDCLTQFEDFSTWNCDEINLVWRHGNLGKPDDVLNSGDARDSIKLYIQRYFDRLARKTSAPIIVEKTCANSLRVGFLAEIFSHARFIHIVRDGRDVTFSAAKRWVAPIDFTYTLKKLWHVPVIDFPHHFVRYIQNRLAQLTSDEGKQKVWGPRFPLIDQFSKNKSLQEICAKQWVECVEHSYASLKAFDKVKQIEIRYEDFISYPVKEMEKILRWLGANQKQNDVAHAVKNVSRDQSQAWRNSASELEANAMEILSPTLTKLGYL